MWIIPFPEVFSMCALRALAMPLGLNTIIIPDTYDKDTKIAAGMAPISHVLYCVTIPFVFLIYQTIG